MVKISISIDDFQLLIDCLKAYKEFFAMIGKLPIKKAKKLQGQQYINTVDNLIDNLMKGVEDCER